MKTDKRYSNGVPKISEGRELSHDVLVTSKLLTSLKACTSQKALFEKIYKQGVYICRKISPREVVNYIEKRFDVRWAFGKLHLTGSIPWESCVEYFSKGSPVCYVEQIELVNGGCSIVIAHRTGSIRLIFGPDMEFVREEYTNSGIREFTTAPLYNNSEYVPIPRK